MSAKMHGLMEFGNFFTVKQVMERTGLSRSTLWRLVKKGGFPPPIKIGKSARWRESDLDAWEEQLLAKRRPAA
jgi:prophage regulatory protein